MYDPNDPSHIAFEPESQPARARNRWLLWGCIAGGGALLVLVLACAVTAWFLMPDFSEQFLATRAEPEMPAPPEAPESAEMELARGPVLIEEDFEEPSMRWDQSSSQVIDSTYELRVDRPDNDSYGLFLGDGSVKDFDMAVDVQQVSGVPTSEYGIRFRQSGPGDYLMFSISGSGYYRLVRVSDQEYESLVPWTFNGRINTGEEAVNRLRVVADGESISGYINDTRMVEYTDEEEASGQLTLGLVTFDEGDLAVQFDNIAGEVEGRELSEDFSDPENVPWSIGGARISGGEYEIFAGGGISSWQHPLPIGSSEVQNFVVEVDVTLITAGEGASYGIIFGDGGSFDFYTLQLLPEGGMMLLDSQTEEPLLPPVPFDFIEPGTGETNTIRLQVENSNVLAIAVNGEELPPLQSPVPFQEGLVGMIVSSGVGGRVQVRFDNFYLEEIIEGESV
jgi:hypothetical protein